MWGVQHGIARGDGHIPTPGRVTPTPHNALDPGPDTGVMLSTYIVEIGEPVATFTAV
jgi:hypothetical protein